MPGVWRAPYTGLKDSVSLGHDVKGAVLPEVKVMIVATLSMAVIVAQAAVGLNETAVEVVPGSCDTCGVKNSAVVEQIVRLQRCPNGRERERAAKSLRHVDWHCHPDVLGALAYSLIHDPDRSVRREAAETLVRSEACAPEVLRAATSDPSLLTRLWARRGLRSLKHRCSGACSACDVAGTGAITLPDGPVIESGPRFESGPAIEPVPDVAPGSVIESAPGPMPLDGPAAKAPQAAPGPPPIDSSVRPRVERTPSPPAATGLGPLPDPDKDVPPPPPKPEARVSGPRVRVATVRQVIVPSLTPLW